MLWQENNRLIRQFDSETLWIEPWGKDSLRVRATQAAQMPFPPEEWALLSPEAVDVKIDIQGNQATITNGKIKAQITPTGKIIFLNQNGNVLLEEFHRNRKEIMHEFGIATEAKAVDTRKEY